MPTGFHTRTLYFYRFTGRPNFFDSKVLKESLAQALVDFYPVAGRLRLDENDRKEIICNNEGVLFVEAEANGEMDELGEFGPRPKLGLAPSVDYSKGISTYPLFLVQVTRFKCGGVCLGFAYEHNLSDGYSAIHFINTWSDLARGLPISMPPFLDRTVLRARNPPNPTYRHTELQFPTPTKTPLVNHSPMKYSAFKLTRAQLDKLKDKCQPENNLNHAFDGVRPVPYSTYVALAAHAWQAVCRARGPPPPEDTRQETWLYIPVDGRSRLGLPRGYFGNVIVNAVVVASWAELVSGPLSFAVGKVREAVAKIVEEAYLRSALDYLEMHPTSMGARAGSPFGFPNLTVIGWAKLPFYEADFGWGGPIHVGPAEAPSEGATIVMRSQENDGGLLYAVSLPEEQMELFKTYFYNI
ncbi:Shikimate O-hydroxycinnamoyltransferase [Striga hermonthica]|uniref:Shikimate O-hydroxycinnamoyltransferase n=1 Tax=Striga hermonthica TaxID=68872 RepID=A0A9N7NU05_STRHE|nr:Shikimate O-hydroxycinnamoyltransferase [Striga hermonthica]